ncbi:hypothetical protein [Sporosalibacterium faouarense]|uniref:hypothetical protein n=1 Tax=Sporosalibacterium faouarense TaxID=516123 RepID=UPI00192B75A2|nr:hypothetical protein [Sporosalibacterium faouarense]
MAEFYRFFDSTIEDPRKYDADEFAEYFRQILTDGIFNGGTNLQITCEGNNMNVFVNEGYGWIKGYLYKIDNLGVELQLDTADVTYDRIDRVVLRWDKENRFIKAFVLKGTPSSTPLAPDLIRNDRIYEISLAQIRVIAGKSYIDSSQITDERLNSDVCGLVNSLVKVDTTTMQQEFDDFMSSLESEIFVTQDEFNSQANNVNSQIEDLNGDLGNISSLNTTDKSNAVNAINEVKSQGNNIGTQITDLNNNVGDISSLNTTDKSNTVNAINELKSQKDNLGSEVSGLVSDIGSLSALATTDKTSLVNSINELFQNVDSGKTDLYSAIIDHLDVTPASKDFLDLYNTISSIINKGSGTYTTDNISVDGNYLNFSVPEKGVYNDSATIRAGDNDFIESNIRSGISIFGKTGTFTSDATASGSQILDGYTAYVNGQKITGSMLHRSSGNFSSDSVAHTGNSLLVSIPDSGYYGDNVNISLTDNDWVESNIRTGVNIFGKTGALEEAINYPLENESVPTDFHRPNYALKRDLTGYYYAGRGGSSDGDYVIFREYDMAGNLIGSSQQIRSFPDEDRISIDMSVFSPTSDSSGCIFYAREDNSQSYYRIEKIDFSGNLLDIGGWIGNTSWFQGSSKNFLSVKYYNNYDYFEVIDKNGNLLFHSNFSDNSYAYFRWINEKYLIVQAYSISRIYVYNADTNSTTEHAESQAISLIYGLKGEY